MKNFILFMLLLSNLKASAQLKLSKGWIYSDFFSSKNGELYSAKKIVFKSKHSKKTVKWNSDYALLSYEEICYNGEPKLKIKGKYEYDKQRNLLKGELSNTENTWKQGRICKRNNDTLLTINYAQHKDVVSIIAASIETINQHNLSKTIICYANKYLTVVPKYITDVNNISADNIRTLYYQDFFEMVDSTVWFYDKTLKPQRQIIATWESGSPKIMSIPKENKVTFDNENVFHLDDNREKYFYCAPNQEIVFSIPSFFKTQFDCYNHFSNKTPYIKWNKKGHWILYKDDNRDEKRKIKYWK